MAELLYRTPLTQYRIWRLCLVVSRLLCIQCTNCHPTGGTCSGCSESGLQIRIPRIRSRNPALLRAIYPRILVIYVEYSG
ncbi:hypothetical protein BDR07DRAFT_364953 [Suillus spraguei]|nr:hypothetical protein BDR07DRAFT_364953 [Suillus spraguei]